MIGIFGIQEYVGEHCIGTHVDLRKESKRNETKWQEERKAEYLKPNKQDRVVEA